MFDQKLWTIGTTYSWPSVRYQFDEAEKTSPFLAALPVVRFKIHIVRAYGSK